MNKIQLTKFEQKLEAKGYKRYPSIHNADYAWYKGFHKGAYEENRSAYQVCFNIYDWTPYSHRDSSLNDKYSVAAMVLVSRTIDERVDLDIPLLANIDTMETLAESFYQWVEQNIKHKKEVLCQQD